MVNVNENVKSLTSLLLIFFNCTQMINYGLGHLSEGCIHSWKIASKNFNFAVKLVEKKLQTNKLQLDHKMYKVIQKEIHIV